MSTQPLKNLNLPSVPTELKPLLPFLQRADELQLQEPIIAYWSCYHAAQLGIAAKVKDPAARTFLFSLLAFLETLKKDIGPSDAIDNDTASAAYVENFALKIFALADNEDRSGRTTRGTAKKFLAAANFLELLNVFDNAELSEPTEDKIRYAKWKAADIARAFREGRKPIAGPAYQPEPEILPPETPYPPEVVVDIPSPANVPPSIEDTRWLAGGHHPNSLNLEGQQSPGDWSTAATPGSAAFPVTPDDPETGLSDNLPLETASVGDTARTGPPSPAETAARNELISSSFTPTYLEGTQISPSAPPFEATPSFSTSPSHVVPPLPPPPAPVYSYHNQSGPSAPPLPPPDLTPQQIARAQKHCKFAISALDYEDFTQARKELLNALRLIGG